MKYVGSKGRHAREILPLILAGRAEGQAYVEPFVGGANTLQHVGGLRVAGDMHPWLIAMWQEVSRGWWPPMASRLSERLYGELKQTAQCGVGNVSSETAALVGFMGFSMSYGGKWFGGYRRDKTGKRDYGAESERAAVKEFPKLRGVTFHHCSYSDLPLPAGSIIYCDPPYADTLGYATGGFEHSRFWDWVRAKVAEGHKVFVSEYAAPEDFVAIWQKRVNNTLAADTGEKGAMERLWVHESQLID